MSQILNHLGAQCLPERLQTERCDWTARLRLLSWSWQDAKLDRLLNLVTFPFLIRLHGSIKITVKVNNKINDKI